LSLCAEELPEERRAILARPKATESHLPGCRLESVIDTMFPWRRSCIQGRPTGYVQSISTRLQPSPGPVCDERIQVGQVLLAAPFPDEFSVADIQADYEHLSIRVVSHFLEI